MRDGVQEQSETAERVRRFVALTGDERVLVAGKGLAAALQAHAAEVMETDAARLTELPFPRGGFDLAAAVGVLQHIRRPELAVAELARVTRLGGQLLVADRLAPLDPLSAIELDRVERERDPAHTRFLSDADLRGLFEANGLVLLRSEHDSVRETGWYLLRR